MKVAVIGAGAMGGRHAQLLAGLPDVDQVVVVDVDTARAEAVARDFDGRAMDHDRALDVADAIVVATPADLHAMTVDAAISRRIPVLCEKPLTDDLDASARLVALVEEAGAHVQVGFHRRHEPSYAAARSRVADGSLGRVHIMRLTAFDPRVASRSPGEWTPTEAAPLFLHSSIHDFDFVRWMSGQEVVEVSAEGSGRDEPRPPDAREVETALVTMRLSGGTLAVLEATWLHPAGYDSRVEFVADGGHLSMGLSPRAPVEHLDWPMGTEERPAPWRGYLGRFAAAYRAELVSFLAAVRGERPPASTARDGLEAHRVAIAATRAYVERRSVTLGEIRGALHHEVG